MLADTFSRRTEEWGQPGFPQHEPVLAMWWACNPRSCATASILSTSILTNSPTLKPAWTEFTLQGRKPLLTVSPTGGQLNTHHAVRKRDTVTKWQYMCFSKTTFYPFSSREQWDLTQELGVRCSLQTSTEGRSPQSGLPGLNHMN